MPSPSVDLSREFDELTLWNLDSQDRKSHHSGIDTYIRLVNSVTNSIEHEDVRVLIKIDQIF